MKKEQIAPYIKLKYFKKPKDGEGGDFFICTQCKKLSNRFGSGNSLVNPPEYRCEKCAILNYAEDYDFKSLEVAESYRRRMFDVFYLFQEILIGKILKEEKKTFKSLTDEEYDSIISLATDIWRDEKVVSKNLKLNLENLYYQKDIEEEIRDIFNSVSLHRVDLE
ncbi:hypothetical protein A3C57_01205 [Candidatus Nomurabacteria bacterium RIFCSPHIGHO2_02_FULL_33_12]|nr:MAG: hypothetical protein A3C57_01205 [Candidatus Nomurabacteria bacterium RIFCSPHIGHO2_02_FULL_33_12]